MVSAIAQADQRGRRGADDTALGRQSGRPSRCSRPLKPNCRCAVPVWRHHIVWRRVNFSSKSLRGSSRRFEMNPLLMVHFSAGTSFAGFGLVKFQARLERAMGLRTARRRLK